MPYPFNTAITEGVLIILQMGLRFAVSGARVWIGAAAAGAAGLRG